MKWSLSRSRTPLPAALPYSVLTLALGLLFIAPLIRAESAGAPTAEAAAMLTHVKKLSGEAWEGRGSGSKGEQAATNYIAAHFRSLGFEPAGENGTWFQDVAMNGPFSIGPKSELTVLGDAGLSFGLETEFRPFSSSATAAAEGELVFAGYGIAAKDLYDDYDGLDVAGRIVVALRGAPLVRGWSGNRPVRAHAPFVEKLKTAQARGAVGVIIVNDPRSFPARVKGKPTPRRWRPDSLVRQNIGGEAAIPFVHLTLAAGRKLFSAAFAKGIDKLETAILSGGDGAPRPASRGSRVRVRLSAEVQRKVLKGRNVCALLRAGAPDAIDEFVVVGAHHDHLGRGQQGSLARSRKERTEIHNGADDNGSGTAGCLEVARILAPLRGRLRRSILFITFTGEERGLLGSRHYCDKPTIPLAKTVAMLNMDMIGRRETRPLFVGGVKTSPSFGSLIESHAKELDLPVQLGDGGLAPSDNTSFYRKRLPVLFFFTGLHRDYHRPSDDWEKLDTASMQKIASLCARTALDVANLKERPKFVRADQGGNGPPRAILGINVGRGEGGVGVASARPGGPAVGAGVQTGDVILAIDGKKTPDIARLRTIMRNLRIGQKIKLSIRRGAQTLEIELKLGRG